MNQTDLNKWIEELLDIMEKKSVAELEVTNGKDAIKLSRGSVVAPVMAAAPVAAASSTAEASAGDSDNFDSHKGAVKSPIVGTAYLSPQPGADNFVKLGDKVKEGQTLLIVEAMKVMNSITAHCSGTLTHFPVSDADPVEFGQVLAVIE